MAPKPKEKKSERRPRDRIMRHRPLQTWHRPKHVFNSLFYKPYSRPWPTTRWHYRRHKYVPHASSDPEDSEVGSRSAPPPSARRSVSRRPRRRRAPGLSHFFHDRYGDKAGTMCCGVGFVSIGIIVIIVGAIVTAVLVEDKSDLTTPKKKRDPRAGPIMMGIGGLLLLIGVIVCITAYIRVGLQFLAEEERSRTSEEGSTPSAPEQEGETPSAPGERDISMTSGVSDTSRTDLTEASDTIEESGRTETMPQLPIARRSPSLHPPGEYPPPYSVVEPPGSQSPRHSTPDEHAPPPYTP